jgi:taurine dioxygenase
MHLAWDMLPAHLRESVEGRFAEHTYLAKYAELQKRSPWRPNLSAEQIAEVKPVVQPMVRTHPETGRKALFVSEHFTTRVIGLPEDESKQLLEEIFAHSVRPEHLYRHVWAEHDMVSHNYRRRRAGLTANSPACICPRADRSTDVRGSVSMPGKPA